MTKKDYELIAAVFRDNAAEDREADGFRRELARDFAAAFAADNPRFDREQFLIACGNMGCLECGRGFGHRMDCSRGRVASGPCQYTHAHTRAFCGNPSCREA